MSTLGKIPTGVKAFRAIESLKESELSNLDIPLKMFRNTVKSIAELYLDYAHDYFVNPKTVYNTESGEPDYFDIIGQGGIDARKRLNEQVPQATPIKKDYKLRIEIDNRAAFTEEGKKAQILDLLGSLTPFIQGGFITPDFVKILLKELTESFKVGSIQEVMQALDQLDETGAIDDRDIEKIKVAMLETMNDVSGQPAPVEGAENVPTQI